MINYSKTILDLRKKLNISQEKLARSFDVSFATINRWEKGHYIPTNEHIDKLKELCDINGIKIDK